MVRPRVVAGMAVALAMSVAGSLHAQQNPVARQQPRGLGVSPTFEGWYQNPDGTYTLSFGFINRNTVEVLTIPVGARNAVSPGPVDQGQPTYFPPGREYGVFTVTVPADFGPDDRVTWTLEANGEKWAIPGGLLNAYETDNLYARATDEKPPVLVLDEGGVESRGPNGARVQLPPQDISRPLRITVAAWEEHHGKEVTLRWYKYRGPGEVTFNPQEVPVVESDLQHEVARFGPEGVVVAGTTTATFSEPGDYVLYVRVDHSDVRVAAAGLEQCCWTNGYMSVTVTEGEGQQP